MAIANDLIGVILGEAVSGSVKDRLTDMISIYSAIKNRAAATGADIKSIISAKDQFDAYGKKIPDGADKYSNLAQLAVDYVDRFGPSHNGTYYATPKAAKKLPRGLKEIGSTAGHKVFIDPQYRHIVTADGALPLNRAALTGNGLPANVPTPSPRPETGAVDAVNRMAASSVPEMAGGSLGERSIPTNADMGPLMSSYAGASRMTRPSAVNVAQDVLNGPYEQARQYYSMATGNRTLPPINDMIAKAGTSRERKTPNSQHFQGKAIDFSVKGLSNPEKIALNEALALSGFKGRGYGTNILHADTRANPSGWRYGNSTFAGQPVGDFVSSAKAGSVPPELQVRGPMPNVPTPSPRPVPMKNPAPVRNPLGPMGNQTAPAPAANPNAIFDPNAGKPSPAMDAPKFTPSPRMAQKQSMDALVNGSVPDAVGGNSTDQLLATKKPVAAPASAPALANAPRVAQPVQASPRPAMAGNALNPPVQASPRMAQDDSMRRLAGAAQRSVGPAMDVFNGKSDLGRANNGNMLMRDDIGNIHSYSPRYDMTTILTPDGGMGGSYSGGPQIAKFGSLGDLGGKIDNGVSNIEKAFSKVGDKLKSLFDGPAKPAFEPIKAGELQALASNIVPGLAFPTAPNMAGAMRAGLEVPALPAPMANAISPAASASIANGIGGLF